MYRYEELSSEYIPKMSKIYDLLSQAEQHALIEMKKDGAVAGRFNILNVLGFLVGILGLVLTIYSLR